MDRVSVSEVFMYVAYLSEPVSIVNGGYENSWYRNRCGVFNCYCFRISVYIGIFLYLL